MTKFLHEALIYEKIRYMRRYLCWKDSHSLEGVSLFEKGYKIPHLIHPSGFRTAYTPNTSVQSRFLLPQHFPLYVYLKIENE